MWIHYYIHKHSHKTSNNNCPHWVTKINFSLLSLLTFAILTSLIHSLTISLTLDNTVNLRAKDMLLYIKTFCGKFSSFPVPIYQCVVKIDWLQNNQAGADNIKLSVETIFKAMGIRFHTIIWCEYSYPEHKKMPQIYKQSHSLYTVGFT